MNYPPVIARMPMVHESVQRVQYGVHHVRPLYTHWLEFGWPFNVDFKFTYMIVLFP